jgi:hypothetical protein
MILFDFESVSIKATPVTGRFRRTPDKINAVEYQSRSRRAQRVSLSRKPITTEFLPPAVA